MSPRLHPAGTLAAVAPTTLHSAEAATPDAAMLPIVCQQRAHLVAHIARLTGARTTIAARIVPLVQGQLAAIDALAMGMSAIDTLISGAERDLDDCNAFLAEHEVPA